MFAVATRHHTHPVKSTHPQTGHKLHAVVVRPVDKQLQRVVPRLLQRTHIASRPPVLGRVELLVRARVEAELLADRARVEEAVTCIDCISRSRHHQLSNWYQI
jgi:hypothetical protein